MRPAPRTDVFHAVADSTRRAILDHLRPRGLTVGDLAGYFPISRPAVSKHLRILLEAGLVTGRRNGRNRVYGLNAAPLAQVDRWVARYRDFWTAGLANLKRHVEGRVRK